MANTPGLKIEVRRCEGLEEFRACMEVERRVWGPSDLDVPLPVYVVAAESGGQVLAAFAGSQIVGFTLAMAGVRAERPYLHSHMTAVLPEWRGKHVALELKLHQRREALDRGITLVEWTFDPLEIKNAYFNLVRLGAFARRLLPNCYGVTTSPLHAGLDTDRLIAEWWLNSPRVKAAIAGRPAQPRSPVRIELPRETDELRQRDRAAAARLQQHLREEFAAWFGRRYVATGFEISAERAAYLLEPAPPED